MKSPIVCWELRFWFDHGAFFCLQKGTLGILGGYSLANCCPKVKSDMGVRQQTSAVQPITPPPFPAVLGRFQLSFSHFNQGKRQNTSGTSKPRASDIQWFWSLWMMFMIMLLMMMMMMLMMMMMMFFVVDDDDDHDDGYSAGNSLAASPRPFSLWEDTFFIQSAGGT